MVALVDLLQQMLHDLFLALSEVVIFIPNVGLNVLHFCNYRRQKAHDILSKEFCNPPTINALSKMVFLNEQKLKAGFSARYHMSINQYTTSLKMALAENLLSTTELSIDEIAKKIGYNHSGNFIKMFKKVHGKTPLSFRKLKS